MKRILFFILISLLSLFNLSAQTWDEVIKSVASDREDDARFGYSVSISGNKAVVGAYGADGKELTTSSWQAVGAAYVFEYDGASWVQSETLVSSDYSSYDIFGYSVSISGDRIVVGAFQEDHDELGGNLMYTAGSAYVFEYDGGSWGETAKLVASDRGSDDYFGRSVSIDGDRIIVGANQNDDDDLGGNFLSDSGAAYIFEHDGVSWAEVAKLVASDRGIGDYFGESVDISGDRVLVGTSREDEDASGGNTLTDSGSAYLFEYDGASWVQVVKLTASDRNTGDYFGFKVRIEGDRVIVGAPREDEDASGNNFISSAGSVYIYEYNGITWSETEKLVANDRGGSYQFGQSIDIDGDKIVVGSVGNQTDDQNNNTINFSGAAYVFKYNAGVWSQEAKVVATDRGEDDLYGISSGISNNRVIIGSHQEGEDENGQNSLTKSGSAYFYEYCNVTAPTGDVNQNFCQSANISDLSVSGLDIQWYNSPNGGDLLGGSESMTSGETYYASQTIGACTSPTRLAVTVTINPLPIVTASSDVSSLCDTGDVNLSASGTATTYNWDNGLGSGTNVSDNISNTTTYTVTGTDGNLCENTDQVTVVVNTSPSPIVNYSTQSGNLYTSTYMNYQWYLNGEVINGATSKTYTPTENGSYAVEVTDNNSCTGISSEYTISDLVGVRESNILGLSIYPNPTSNELTISVQENVNIELKDINGKVLYSAQNITGENKLDMSPFTKGVYILQIDNGLNITTQKVIKQ